MSARVVSNPERYCSYCEAYRQAARCEVCGLKTYPMKFPAPSDLPREWRTAATASPSHTDLGPGKTKGTDQ